MDLAGKQVSSIISGALGALQDIDGGSVLMNRIDTTNGSDLRLVDYITILSTFRQLMGHLHYYNLILLFRDCPLNATHVRTLLINHSRKVNESCSNIFIAMLHSYSFLDILTMFCNYKDLKELKKLNERSVFAVYDNVFKASFEINGGMREFDNFVGTPDMDAIFNSVRSCYVEEGFFTTPVPSMGENKVYGENFNEPSQEFRQKILVYYLQHSPRSLRNNLLSLAEALIFGNLPNSSEDLNMTERTDFSNLLNRRFMP